MHIFDCVAVRIGVVNMFGWDSESMDRAGGNFLRSFPVNFSMARP